MKKEIEIIMDVLNNLNKNIDFQDNEIDFEVLFHLCIEQKIFYVVYNKLRKSFLEKCKNSKTKNTYENLFKLWELKQPLIENLMLKISKSLNGKLEYCFCKGKILSNIIYSNNLRAYNDIDMFVMREDMLTCNEIFYQIGLRLKDYSGTNVTDETLLSLLNKYNELIYLDLKTKIKIEIKCCDYEITDNRVKLFLSNKTKFNNFNTLSKEDAFIYLILTIYKNMYKPTSIICDYNIRDIVDIYYFVKNAKLNYEYIYRVLKQEKKLYIADYVFLGISNVFKNFSYPFDIKTEEKEDDIYHLNFKDGHVNTFFEREKRILEYKKMYADSFSKFGYVNRHEISNKLVFTLNDHYSVNISIKNNILNIKFITSKSENHILFNTSILCNDTSNKLFYNVMIDENDKVLMSDFKDIKFINNGFEISLKNILLSNCIVMNFAVLNSKTNTIIASKGYIGQPCSFVLINNLGKK